MRLHGSQIVCLRTQGKLLDFTTRIHTEAGANMAALAAVGRLFERGVWRAPYLVRGLPALIAVDAMGVARRHVVIEPGADVVRLSDELLDVLNEMDLQDAPSRPTRPHLELVKPAPLPSPPTGVIPLAPRATVERFAAKVAYFDPYAT